MSQAMNASMTWLPAFEGAKADEGVGPGSNHETSSTGLGDAVGDWRPVSVGARRIELFAKMLNIRYRKASFIKSAGPVTGSFAPASEKKSKGLGFLHYKTWVTPATATKKKILHVTIIAADGLEQGVFSRYPYVKIIHGAEVFKTPASSKSTAAPVWNLSFKIELEEDDQSQVLLEVWASRSVGSDWMMGRIAFVPAMRREQLSEYWEELMPSSSAQRLQQDVTMSMLKRAHRTAKRARERTPEYIMAKRLEIRKRKAISIQNERQKLIDSGWIEEMAPVKPIKRRMPASVSNNIALICLIAFVIFIVLLAFLPGELMTLMGL